MYKLIKKESTEKNHFYYTYIYGDKSENIILNFCNGKFSGADFGVRGIYHYSIEEWEMLNSLMEKEIAKIEKEVAEIQRQVDGDGDKE